MSNEIRLDIFAKLCLWDPDEATRRRATKVIGQALGLSDLDRQNLRLNMIKIP